MAELQFSGSRRDLWLWKRGGYDRLRRWVCAYVRWREGEVGGKKEKNREEKGKEDSHELSLKMNEKMGNPRVTA